MEFESQRRRDTFKNAYLPPTPHTVSPIYIFKLLKTKDKEKIIKASRGKRHTTYKGTKVRIKADFSSEKLYDQKKIEWCWKKKVSTQNSIPSKNVLQTWRRYTFFRWTKIKFITSRSALEEMVKEVLAAERIWYQRETWIYYRNEDLWKWME